MDAMPPLLEEFSPLFENCRLMKMTEKSAFVIAVAALEAGLDVRFLRKLPGENEMPVEERSATLFAIAGGGRTEYLKSSMPVSWITPQISLAAKDKILTKVIFDKAGVTTPFGGAARAGQTSILESFRKAGVSRVTLKPTRGSGAKGVVTGLTLEEARQVIEGVPYLTFLVEQHIGGAEFRTLVIDGRVVAATQRLPPVVTGNGAFDIARLIAEENAYRARHPDGHHRQVAMAAAEAYLAKRGDWTGRVPAMGERVRLAGTDRPTNATVHVDRSDSLPPEVARASIRAAEALRVRLGGLDVRLDAKGRPYVLELNQKPWISVHSIPYRAPRWSPTVARAIVAALFPGAAPRVEVERLDLDAIRDALRAPGGPEEVDAAGYAAFKGAKGHRAKASPLG